MGIGSSSYQCKSEIEAEQHKLPGVLHQTLQEEKPLSENIASRH
jgi:hypothetical protein